MSDKISVIAEKIYSEGLEKANKEKIQIISKAKEEAANILASAEKEAQEIIERAKKQQEKEQQITSSEIKMAGEQALNVIRQNIKTLVIDRLLAKGLTSAFDDAKFNQDLLINLLNKWDGKESLEIKTHPELVESLENALKESLPHVLPNLELSVVPDAKGFVVLDKTNHFEIAFTDAQFKALLSPFLKETTQNLLFDSKS